MRERDNTVRLKERDIGVILQIEQILCTKGKYYQLSPVEEDPTQIRLCIEPTTPCASPRIEVREEALPIIVSEGSQNSSKSSQSSGNSMLIRNQLVVSGRNIT
jgi:hypothetical protein